MKSQKSHATDDLEPGEETVESTSVQMLMVVKLDGAESKSQDRRRTGSKWAGTLFEFNLKAGI